MKLRAQRMEGKETGLLGAVAPEMVGSLIVRKKVLRRKKARQMCFCNQGVSMKK
jgi:hypothetical protein